MLVIVDAVQLVTGEFGEIGEHRSFAGRGFAFEEDGKTSSGGGTRNTLQVNTNRIGP